MDKTDINSVPEGCILAEPLYAKSGAVILQKDVVLTESIIVRLQRMGVEKIAVRDAASLEGDSLETRIKCLDLRFARHQDSEIMMCIRDQIAEQISPSNPMPFFAPEPDSLPSQEDLPASVADKSSADRLRGRILRTLRLQTLPDNVQRMSQVLDNPSSTLSDVSREIEKDPAMASQVLKLVNSGFCGLRGRVSAIQHAAALLGFNTLKTVLLSATMNDRMKGPLAALWDHSLACSRISSLLARALGVDEPEEVASAGLLHDIGKTALFECVPDKFKQTTKIAQTHDLLSIDAEQHLLGLTHEETGSLLLGKWNIPQPSIAAVAYHHHPEQAGDYAHRAALVHVADALVRAWGIGLDDEQHVPAIAPEACEILNLSTGGIRETVSRMDQELRDILQLPIYKEDNLHMRNEL